MTMELNFYASHLHIIFAACQHFICVCVCVCVLLNEWKIYFCGNRVVLSMLSQLL
jgi:hypothetical protein